MKKSTSPIVIDNNSLVIWFNAPKSVEGQKLDFLFLQAKENRQKIIIPTPVLAEFLAYIDAPEARQKFMQQLRRSPVVSIEPFDEPAAIEASDISKIRQNASLTKSVDKPKQKIKVDTQIVAIAKTHFAALIVSNDGDVKKLSDAANIVIKGLEDLDLPPSPPQGNFFP
ncbi:MAG: hypothetical protein RL344_322 [Pseudomonadota bacterium]|jgi:predicted nucleic acid-binding protein